MERFSWLRGREGKHGQKEPGVCASIDCCQGTETCSKTPVHTHSATPATVDATVDVLTRTARLFFFVFLFFCFFPFFPFFSLSRLPPVVIPAAAVYVCRSVYVDMAPASHRIVRRSPSFRPAAAILGHSPLR